jgi:rhamnose transport system substrate-binding protein
MALAIVLAGCGSTVTTPTTPPVTDTLTATAAATTAPVVVAPSTSRAASVETIVGPTTGRIAVIGKKINDPYFDAAFKGSQNAAFQFGGTEYEVSGGGADPSQLSPVIQTVTAQGGAQAIIIAPNDPTADAPAMEQAMAAGVKVVGFDSSPAPGSYDVFVEPVDASSMGETLAQMACDEAPNCTGEIAILSTAQDSTDQNAWIAAMRTALASSKYASLKLDGTYYGDDNGTTTIRQTEAMLAAHPGLKVIVALTTAGIVAAAQVVASKSKTGSIFVTGIGTPQEMAVYVHSGVAPEFAIWNVTDLGYLAYAVAVGLLTGQIKGTAGETFTVPSDPSLHGGQPYTIGANNEVVLGHPFIFNAQNIDQYIIPFGF